MLRRVFDMNPGHIPAKAKKPCKNAEIIKTSQLTKPVKGTFGHTTWGRVDGKHRTCVQIHLVYIKDVLMVSML